MEKKTTSRFRQFINLPIELVQNRTLIGNLAKNDFKTRFAGSYLGVIWAFVQPIVTVVVYWFVFTVGLRQGRPSGHPFVLWVIWAFVQPIVTVVVYWFVFTVGLRQGRPSGHPFVLWLMAGLVPWFFFSEALNGGTNALIEYNYLVKKVVFNIDILPLVKVLSAMFVHVIFIVFTMILCWCNGYTPSLYWLQIIYYMICSFLLVLGLAYFTSAVVVFFRDLIQIINIVLQVGVWMTPIMWNLSDILVNHPTLAKIFKLNPMYYIVEGFRNALLDKVWFWEKPLWTLVFWVITVLFFVIGVNVFNRLKIHFADVL